MFKTVNINEFHTQWLKSQENGDDFTIIDVREPHEYTQGHVPGANLVVLNTIPARSDEIPQKGDVYMICHLGGRSAQAIQFLAKNCGHTNLINVVGGTSAWIQAGYPIQKGE